jgi:DNA repair exonuclease SbcCD nuclease subunit
MAKALVVSDLHIHSHKDSVDRLEHCLRVLRWVFDEADHWGCSYILFLGDLFHERTKIDVLNYLRTFEVFMEYFIARRSPKQMYLLIGNHDMYHKERWDVNSVKPLSAISNIHIVDEPKTINIGGVDIDFCPHTLNPINDLENLKKGRGSKDLRLLLGHLAVHGATLNKLYGTRADVIVEHDTEMVAINPELFDDWKLTLLGHYHAAQKLNDKVEYVGSPLQLSFGEAFQEKHLMVLDLDTLDRVYVPNEFSPRHYIISPGEEDAYNLDSHFVRMVIDDMGAKGLLELRNKITQKYNVASFDFKVSDKRPDQDIEMVEEAKILMDNHEQIMTSFVENAILPDGIKDRKRLLEKGLGICQTVL